MNVNRHRTPRKVAILGGGAGARSASVEIGLLGHEVVITDHPDLTGHLAGLAASGQVQATGVISGIAPVKVAANIPDAVSGADVVLIVVPTMYQRTFADLVAPSIAPETLYVLMPGSLGSLDFLTRLRELGVEADLTVAEIAALPYATRISGPTSVRVFGRRRYVQAGVFPANRTAHVQPLLDDLYPGIEMMANVLEAGLNNPNPTLHCLGVLLSASRIEYSHGEFYYYEEGMTPHVCQAIEAIDAERVSIGEALGVKVLSLKETYPRMGYGPSGDSFWSVIRGVAALHGIKGPGEVDSRYLTEDVPIGLTIYSQLGAAVGVPTPIMDSVITLAGALLSTSWEPQRRTLERCGINGLSRGDLLRYVANGQA